jgi:hypothetical protein
MDHLTGIGYHRRYSKRTWQLNSLIKWVFISKWFIKIEILTRTNEFDKSHGNASISQLLCGHRVLKRTLWHLLFLPRCDVGLYCWPGKGHSWSPLVLQHTRCRCWSRCHTGCPGNHNRKQDKGYHITIALRSIQRQRTNLCRCVLNNTT